MNPKKSHLAKISDPKKFFEPPHSPIIKICEWGPWEQGLVVRRVDNFIPWINPYLVEKIGAFLILIGQWANFMHWIGIHPLNKIIHSLYNQAQDN